MKAIVLGALLALPLENVLAAGNVPPAESDPSALRGRAEELRDAGKLWEALAYADRAEDRAQAGELRLQLGDFPGAESDFKLALERRPDDSGLLLLLARSKRERQADALADAERAARAPGSAAADRAAAHLFASELKIDLGDSTGAEKSAESALKESPDNLDALYAAVRLKRDRRERALPYAERAAAAAAKAPQWRRAAAYRLSARVWLELGAPERAAESLRRALAVDPEDLDALGYAVQLKKKLTPTELARFRRAPAAAPAAEIPPNERGAEAALARDPNDLEALRALASAGLSRGQRAAAAGAALRFTRAVWKTPLWQQAEAYRTAAKLWIRLGEQERAFQSLAKAFALQQDSLETHKMALLLPRGVPTLTEGPKSAALFYSMAAAMRLELQDRAGAGELVGLALTADPSHAWALRLKSSLEKGAK